MDLELSRSTSLDSLCEGCLSSDRKLKLIRDVEVLNFFSSILNKYVYSQHTLRLCWECIAVVRKTLKFMKQVEHVHQCLMQYVVHTALQPLTSLATTQQNFIDIQCQADADPSEVKCEEAQREVAFIKVENDDDFYDGCDDAIDDQCIEPVVSPSVKRCDEFNESDDEPLTKVKQQGEPGVKRRRGRPRKTDVESKREKGTRKRKDKCGVISNPRVEKKLQKLNVAPGELEMVVLSWEEVEAERQKALNSAPFTTLTYKCYHCAIGFSHKFKLDNHMKKHDSSSGPLRCSVCSVYCGRSAPALAAHRRRHRVRWRCVRCGAEYSRASVAADHQARDHRGTTPAHRCRCGRTYSSLSQLRRHVRSHGDKQECSLCGKMFGDTTALRTHLFIHKGEKEFACTKCDKRFLFKKAMEIHMETHNASANLYCHECDLNFKNKMSYYQHMKYNLKHIDPAKLKFACHLCDKKFAKASRLNEHNLGVHLKITPFKCTVPDCNFSSSSRPALRTHARMAHRGARALRNHVCHRCGKAYTTNKVLEGHLRTHSGERPFRCDQCGAAFSYRGALYNHTRLVHKKCVSDQPSGAVPHQEGHNWQVTVAIPEDAQEHPVDIT